MVNLWSSNISDVLLDVILLKFSKSQVLESSIYKFATVRWKQRGPIFYVNVKRHSSGQQLTLASGQGDKDTHTLSYESLFGFLPIQPVGNEASGLVFYSFLFLWKGHTGWMRLMLTQIRPVCPEDIYNNKIGIC